MAQLSGIHEPCSTSTVSQQNSLYPIPSQSILSQEQLPKACPPPRGLPQCLAALAARLLRNSTVAMWPDEAPSRH
ncbi:hypothetical protein MDA_GLEAN10025857 [Myotis davidii]|uniref:Uncharacterized protein n=1 Tax=Myotis davidii TaxID=225400 RepID=L5LXU2_MYODS|nr:hypothetical protein MDA_GLEAN10025857 [Myotis davidii]